MFLTNGDASNWDVVSDDALRAPEPRLARRQDHADRPDTGQGLPDNPYWNGDPNAARSKVWAYGVRNAFRFSVRPNSGTPGHRLRGRRRLEHHRGGRRRPEGRQPRLAVLRGQRRAARLPAQAGLPGAVRGRRRGSVEMDEADHHLRPQRRRGRGHGRRLLHRHDLSGRLPGRLLLRRLRAQPDPVRDASTRATSSRPGRPTSIAARTRPSTSRSDPDGNLYYLSIAPGEAAQVRLRDSPRPVRRLPERPDLDVGDERLGAGRAGQVERRAGGRGRPARSPSTASPTPRASARTPPPTSATRSRGCTTFQSDVGLDDEVGTNGSVVFQVYLDGTKTYDSGAMTGATATKSINLDLTGKSELRLVVTNGGDNIDYDHADWADARHHLHGGGGGGGGFGAPPTFGPATSLHGRYDIHTRSSPPTSTATGSSTSSTRTRSPNNVTVFKGNGNGTFLAGTSFTVGAGTKPKTAPVADVNGDGKLDIVTANQDTSTISVLKGNGDGAFAAARAVRDVLECARGGDRRPERRRQARRRRRVLGRKRDQRAARQRRRDVRAGRRLRRRQPRRTRS